MLPVPKSEKGKEGWVFKVGGSFKSWKKRYAMRRGNLIQYMRDPRGACKGVICLDEVVAVGLAPECDKQPAIRIVLPLRTHYFVTEFDEDCDAWIDDIRPIVDPPHFRCRIAMVNSNVDVPKCASDMVSAFRTDIERDGLYLSDGNLVKLNFQSVNNPCSATCAFYNALLVVYAEKLDSPNIEANVAQAWKERKGSFPIVIAYDKSSPEMFKMGETLLTALVKNKARKVTLFAMTEESPLVEGLDRLIKDAIDAKTKCAARHEGDKIPAKYKTPFRIVDKKNDGKIDKMSAIIMGPDTVKHAARETNIRVMYRASPITMHIASMVGQRVNERNFQKSRAAVLCYDATKRETFRQIDGLHTLARDCDSRVIVALGNPSVKEVVSVDEGCELAKKLNCSFIEIDAAGTNTDRIWIEAVRRVFRPAYISVTLLPRGGNMGCMSSTRLLEEQQPDLPVEAVKPSSKSVRCLVREGDQWALNGVPPGRIFTQQSRTLQKVNHPCILKVLRGNGDDEDRPTLYVEKGVVSSLHREMNKGGLMMTNRYRAVVGIALAMKYFHCFGLAHQFLSLKCVALAARFQPKIDCFGYAGRIGEQVDFWRGRTCYTAPEISERGTCSGAADVYSLGVILHEMLSGGKASKHWSNLVGDQRPYMPKGTAEPVRALIEMCWSSDPLDRPAMSSVFESLVSLTPLVTGVDIETIKVFVKGIDVDCDVEGLMKPNMRAGGHSACGADLGDFYYCNECGVQVPYAQRQELGAGSYGRVYRAANRHTGVMYAVKIMNTIKQEHIARFESEVRVMQRVEHDGFVRLFDFAMPDKRGGGGRIVMELLEGGSLQQKLSEYQTERLTPTERMIIAYSLSCAMMHMHAQNIIHRDLKPANIMLDAKLHPKITDFGLARDVDIEMTIACGTPVYMAPELDEATYDSKVDVYSFGFLLYELVLDTSPSRYISVNSPKELKKMVGNGWRPPTEGIEIGAYKIITQAWANDPKSRPSFMTICRLLLANVGTLVKGCDESQLIAHMDSLPALPEVII